MRLETIRKHDTSSSHTSHVMREQAKTAKPGTSMAERSLQSLNKAAFQRLSVLFRSAHALAKHGRPYSDFGWILNLQEAAGTDVGSAYRNDKRAREFIHYVAKAEQENTKSMVSNAKFVSLISDGATDASHCEAEILYIRSALEGEVKIKFVGIENIGRADATNIEAAICSMMSCSFGDVWKDKVVGMGTDGASVMVGKVGGVVTKLKQRLECPFLIGVHCSAHRLELAYRDACKDVLLFKKIDGLLLNMYLYYRNSPLNRYNLKQSYITLGIPVLMPSRVGGTRWLPHTQRAISTVLTGFKALYQHLSQLSNPDAPASRRGDAAAKARNFLSLLTNKSAYAFLHFLWDVTNCLAKVSRAFQDKTSTLVDIHKEIEVAKHILESYLDRDGPKLKDVNFDSFEEICFSGNLASFESARKHMLMKLLESLTDRFEKDSDVLKAASIVSLNLWPAKLNQDPDFGNDMIAVLARRFAPALQRAGFQVVDFLAEEWIAFKTLLYESFDNITSLDWPRINSVLKNRCSSVLALVDLVLSLPASSAEAERGFSLMKRIKTDWRSNLSSASLSDLMLVCLETGDIKTFDPQCAIHMWFQKDRFPDTSDSKQEHAQGNLVSSVVSNSQIAIDVAPVVGDDVPEDFIEEDFYSDSQSDTELNPVELTLQEQRAYALFRDDLLSSGFQIVTGHKSLTDNISV